ncbi:MAG: ACT domain-containing protein [Spirochaetales bacterium]|nr:ACT domain-containing protein [Spirochaetales bacterium]
MGVQLAVFLENQPGKLEAVTKILAEAGVNIRGITMASEGEFGVLKILVNDPARAHEALKGHHYTVTERTVVVALIDDRPGRLHDMLATLSSHRINIEDCYGIALEEGRQAAIVLDVERFPEAEAVLAAGGIRVLSDRELYSL